MSQLPIICGTKMPMSLRYNKKPRFSFRKCRVLGVIKSRFTAINPGKRPFLLFPLENICVKKMRMNPRYNKKTRFSF